MLAIKALLEVVQSGSKFMELAVMEKGKPLEVRHLCRPVGFPRFHFLAAAVSGSRTD